jgi:hypothetical protein
MSRAPIPAARPSRQGGDLGAFGPGMMVPEFDRVVFNEAVGVVHGPVKTQFGYHLLESHQPQLSVMDCHRTTSAVR